MWKLLYMNVSYYYYFLIYEVKLHFGVFCINFLIFISCIVFGKINSFSVGKSTRFSGRNYYEDIVRLLILFYMLNSYIGWIFNL